MKHEMQPQNIGEVALRQDQVPAEYDNGVRKLPFLERRITDTYIAITALYPPSPILVRRSKLRAYASVRKSIYEGVSRSIDMGEKAKELFADYLGDYKEDGNVKGLENIPADRPFIIASNHWNGNPFRLDPRILRPEQKSSGLERTYRHDPLKGFWQVPVIHQLIRENAPENDQRRIRFIVEVRKYILDDLRKKLSRFTHGISDPFVSLFLAGMTDMDRILLDVKSDMFKYNVHKMTEHIMGNMAKAMDFISKETGTRQISEAIREKQDILGVFPSGQAEYELKRGLPEAGSVFELAARHNIEVLPIACWFDGKRIQVRIGRPFLCSQVKGDKESSQKTSDKVMIAIGSILPEDMWGEYAEEIRQSKHQAEPIPVFPQTRA